MKLTEIDSAYQNLWLRFKATCDEAGYHALASPSRGFVIRRETPQIVTVNSLIYLRTWPYKSSSGRKQVDIIVRGYERFTCAQDEITKSTIQVLYFDVKAGKASPLLGLHYDFETPVQAAHPVFHAQLGLTEITPQERKELSFRWEIQNPVVPLYRNARIPTPHMNLGSVLLALVADHLPSSFYQSFLQHIRQNQATRWNAACSSLRSSLAQHGGYLHSHHWY